MKKTLSNNLVLFFHCDREQKTRSYNDTLILQLYPTHNQLISTLAIPISTLSHGLLWQLVLNSSLHSTLLLQLITDRQHHYTGSSPPPELLRNPKAPTLQRLLSASAVMAARTHMFPHPPLPSESSQSIHMGKESHLPTSTTPPAFHSSTKYPQERRKHKAASKTQPWWHMMTYVKKGRKAGQQNNSVMPCEWRWPTKRHLKLPISLLLK